MSNNPSHKQPAGAFAAAFAAALSETLTRSLGSEWPLEVLSTGELPTHPAEPIHFRITLDGALRGNCFIEFYQPQIAALSAKLAKNPGANPAAVLHDLMAQSMTRLSAALAPRFGEVQLRIEPVSGLAFGGMYAVPVRAAADPAGAPMLLYFDASLLASLCAAPGSAQDAAAPAVDPLNLKLVMDVELNVSLRFGQRQLPLREVLELASGSVVELDRMVNEPVELLLDGKLIARGEAVIVDGNYGLRVTEIPQPVSSHFLQ